MITKREGAFEVFWFSNFHPGWSEGLEGESVTSKFPALHEGQV